MPTPTGREVADWLVQGATRLSTAAALIPPSEAGYGSARGTGSRIYSAINAGVVRIPCPVPTLPRSVFHEFANGALQGGSGQGARLLGQFLYGFSKSLGDTFTVPSIRVAMADGLRYVNRTPVMPVRGGVVDVLSSIHAAVAGADTADPCELLVPMRNAAALCAVDDMVKEGFRPDPGGVALAIFLGVDPPDPVACAALTRSARYPGGLPPESFGITCRTTGRFSGVVSIRGPAPLYQWGVRCSNSHALIVLDVSPTTTSIRFSVEDVKGPGDLRVEVVPMVEGHKVARTGEFFWQR